MAASNLIEANSREVDVGATARTKAMSVNEITLKRNVDDLVNKGSVHIRICTLAFPAAQ